MDREPDDLEVSILALFGREPLNRHGARRIQDILSQIPAGSVSYDQLAAILSDMIHAGWLVGRILPGTGGVAADIVEIDITCQGTKLVAENEEASLSRQIVLPTASAQGTSAIEPQPPKCFISYSWDSEDHRAWVRKLAEGLRAYHVDAILDQWGVQPGTDLAHFMESAGQTDFVIVVCTPDYARKANEGEASVGYEKRIITAKLRKLHPEDRAIIPVLRTGGTNAIPTFLVDLAYLDFTIDDDFDVRLKDLARAVFEEPECVPPPLGPMPELHPAAPLYVSPTKEETRLTIMNTASVPHTTANVRPWNPIAALKQQYGEQPFYAVWAWPSLATDDFIGTQAPEVREIFRTPLGRGQIGFTLDYAISKATIVQEGLRFSSARQGFDLSDKGSMLFSRPLDGLVWGESTPGRTINPLLLIEYTLSFVQLYLELWRVNHPPGSLMASMLTLNARLCLHNAVGWELRPGKPGTEGYEHLYDLFGPHKPLSSAHLLAPSTGPTTFGINDDPSLVTMSLMKSTYSAFGYAIEDIPYFDPERLVFKF
jgi:hypothetical protein